MALSGTNSGSGRNQSMQLSKSVNPNLFKQSKFVLFRILEPHLSFSPSSQGNPKNNILSGLAKIIESDEGFTQAFSNGL